MLKDCTHDRTVSRLKYLGHSACGSGSDKDMSGNRRINQISDRMMREATGGLCGFDRDGELVLAVDPDKYAEVK